MANGIGRRFHFRGLLAYLGLALALTLGVYISLWLLASVLVLALAAFMAGAVMYGWRRFTSHRRTLTTIGDDGKKAHWKRW